jgi:chemotaxis response regulator CheB
MPRAAIELGAASEVLPLDRIAPAIFTSSRAALP